MKHSFCAPSPLPPANLSPEEVPQFVTFGFDDNAHSGLVTDTLEGVAWASHLFASLTNSDGTKGSCSFYLTTKYITKDHAEEPTDLVKKAWRDALSAGHDVGNHTHNHHWGQEFTKEQWLNEITTAQEILTTEVGTPHNLSPQNIGFRTPFLGYNNATIAAVHATGFCYDCSIEEGSQEDQDGTNFLWPYTLDNGSPGNKYDNHTSNGEIPLVGNYPGLWELPSHMVIAPPDKLCEHYGIDKGFRQRLDEYKHTTDPDNEFNIADGKITGLDYNCLVMFGMNKAEYLGTLKYTLDLRLQGNRAPFTFGAHSDVYATGYDICPNITIAERREAVEEFLAYAQSKPQVVIASGKNIIEWMENPQHLPALRS